MRLLSVAGVLMLTAWAHATPLRPNISETYVADCSVTTLLNGAPGTLTGTMHANHATQQNLLNLSTTMFGKYEFAWAKYCHGPTGNFSMNGQCRPEGNGCYSEYFGFVPFATYWGVKTLDDGTQCDNWGGVFPTTNVSVCVDTNNANLPIEFIVINGNAILREKATPTIIRYHSFTPQNAVDVPMLPSCSVTPYSCPLGPVEEKTVWRLHSPTDYSLINKNVATLPGDVVFLCLFINLKNTAFLSESIFSAFNVTMNTTWSQYSLCNYDPRAGANVCVGGQGQPSQVGREAAYGVLPDSGQCTKKDVEIGEWYSFKDSANAPSGWQTQARVKSINATCLLSESLSQACSSFPYDEATRLVMQAFAECPDMPPPQSQSPATWEELTQRHESEIFRDPLPLLNNMK